MAARAASIYQTYGNPTAPASNLQSMPRAKRLDTRHTQQVWDTLGVMYSVVQNPVYEGVDWDTKKPGIWYKGDTIRAYITVWDGTHIRSLYQQWPSK